MGIEMAAERIAKPTIDELRAQLIELQPIIEAHLQRNEEVPLEQYKAYYNIFCKYIEAAPRPDSVLNDLKRSELATLFRLAKKAVDAGHGEAHHKEWH